MSVRVVTARHTLSHLRLSPTVSQGASDCDVCDGCVNLIDLSG